ncbi:MAG: metal ABC transporter permease [Chloroflexota bacterium]|nr:metal ABC transporter permease [Chloroflexota bacterium]
MDILSYPFMQRALIAGVLVSITCGVIGTYVVVRRMVFVSGGISHASFGGIGLGYFLGFDPVIGAMLFSVASAVSIGAISRRARLPEDTSIGILWAVGMALGVIFIGLSPGYAPDLFGYLFGNILSVSGADLALMAALTVVIVVVVSLFFKEFQSLSFDEEFARVSGVPTAWLYYLLVVLIALAVVILIRAVGIVLLIALLTIPAAISRRLVRSLRAMMLLSVALSALFVASGLWLSYVLDLASGATIILVSGAAFLASLGLRRARGHSAQPE